MQIKADFESGNYALHFCVAGPWCIPRYVELSLWHAENPTPNNPNYGRHIFCWYGYLWKYRR